MDPDAQHLEEISSIREAMRQISQEAEVAVELLDVRIEEELLDGTTEAVLAALRLESGVPLHVRLAKQAGASREEVISAILVKLAGKFLW